MVKLRLGLTGSANAIAPLGLPTGGGFVPAGAYLKVKIADSQGQAVTFDNGVYAPGGNGAAFLTLNMQNNFGATVLLPKGQYTFETVAKDGMNEDATTGTLLAYSKSGLTTVDATSNAVKLTVRAVMNPAATALNFALPTDVLYTNDVVDLRLSVKTNPVGETAFNVPTTDFSIGAYTAVGGTLDARTASKLGVTVTATGTTADPSVTVSVPVTGWVQDGMETASLQTVDVTFTQAINASTVTSDVDAPTASLSTTTAYTGGTTTLMGKAEDIGGKVEAVRLFDGTTLIASTDAAEQGADVTALTFPAGDMNWTAGWVPTTVGDHGLTLIASDDSGNETRIEQTVTVSDAVVVTPSGTPDTLRFTLQPGETRKFLYDVQDIPEGTSNYIVNQYMFDASYWGDGTCYSTDRMDVSAVDAVTGATVNLPYPYAACYSGTGAHTDGGVPDGPADALRDLIFTVTNTSDQPLEINPYLYQQNY